MDGENAFDHLVAGELEGLENTVEHDFVLLRLPIHFFCLRREIVLLYLNLFIFCQLKIYLLSSI